MLGYPRFTLQDSFWDYTSCSSSAYLKTFISYQSNYEHKCKANNDNCQLSDLNHLMHSPKYIILRYLFQGCELGSLVCDLKGTAAAYLNHNQVSGM
jgi:hypothetical protein